MFWGGALSGRAAKKLAKEGFLLKKDEDRIVDRAERDGVNRWLAVP
jgi:hypothetical protein